MHALHWAAYFIDGIHPCSRAEAWIALLCHPGEGGCQVGCKVQGMGCLGSTTDSICNISKSVNL